MATPPPKPVRPAPSAPSFTSAFGLATTPDPVTEVVRKKDGKLHPWMIPAAHAILQQGAPTKYAAEAIGISTRTFGTWIAEGERPDATELKASFATAMKEARAIGSMSHWTRLADLAERDGKVAIHLARIFDPETHTERKEVRVDLHAEPRTTVDLSQLTEEQLALKMEYDAMMLSAPLKILGDAE